MDNIISIEEQSKPPQLYHNNRYLSATVSRVSPWQSINDGIEAMNEIKTKVLDDTFTTDLGGESRDFVEQLEYLLCFGLALLLIFLILAAQFESFIDPFIIILTVPMAAAGLFCGYSTKLGIF
jgi:HAE1 family hydrophobic/amphiphilic exporter-1/multidrug efflux pump